jgi:hypothetical protein
MFPPFRASMTNVAVRLRNGIVACVREAVDRVERKANSVKVQGIVTWTPP